MALEFVLGPLLVHGPSTAPHLYQAALCTIAGMVVHFASRYRRGLELLP